MLHDATKCLSLFLASSKIVAKLTLNIFTDMKVMPGKPNTFSKSFTGKKRTHLLWTRCVWKVLAQGKKGWGSGIVNLWIV